MGSGEELAVSERDGKRLIVIGGVAAGATAAARARRLDERARITIVERGRYVSFANCGLPYFVSRDIPKRSSLVLQTPEGFLSRYGVEVLLETEALSIDREAGVVKVRGPEGEADLPYDSVILALGGAPISPPIPGIEGPNVFNLWTIPDMDAIHRFIEERTARSALVIGGGFIGLEAAEAFLKRGLELSIVELTDHLMPHADPEFGAMIAGAFAEAGARVEVGRSVVELVPGRARLDDGRELLADLVLVAAGVRPNVGLARAAGLAIGEAGGLLVDGELRTSDPRIWAAGDMVEVVHRVSGRKVRVPLAGPANRQGRIAATNALGGSMVYRGAVGTTILKVLEDAFGMTGLSTRSARDAGFDVRTAVVHRAHHVTYYPGAEELSLKLIYDGRSRRLLGAQAFGRQGVDKRIDVAATALAAGLTVDDLAELDLSYAPPFGAANDPLNMVSYAAQNDLSGYSHALPAEEAWDRISTGGAVALDVRTLGEHLKAPIADAIHIPLDELSDRLEELPRDKQIIILSEDGYAGHVGLRRLIQSGFDKISYASGGVHSLRLLPTFTYGERE